MKDEPNKSWATIILIIVLIAGALLFGLMARPTEMGVMVVACAIALAFVNIDRIQRFKGAGFEAEMRKAVEEAYATTENLKSLAKPLVVSMLENLTYSGRWGGMSQNKKHELKKELEALAESLGIKDSMINAALDKFYIWHGIDHIQHLLSVMRQKHISNEGVQKALETLVDRNVSELPPAESVRGALKGLKQEEFNIMEPYIEDYVHYRAHKIVRRIEATSE